MWPNSKHLWQRSTCTPAQSFCVSKLTITTSYRQVCCYHASPQVMLWCISLDFLELPVVCSVLYTGFFLWS